MLRFVDHDYRFIIDKLINGFPTRLILSGLLGTSMLLLVTILAALF